MFGVFTGFPALEGELSYTEVAAGRFHTVLLRSDGTSVACGRNVDDARRCALVASKKVRDILFAAQTEHQEQIDIARARC